MAKAGNPAANICFRFEQPTNSQDIATPLWEAATQSICNLLHRKGSYILKKDNKYLHCKSGNALQEKQIPKQNTAPLFGNLRA